MSDESSGGSNAAESQHAVQSRSTTNAIFIHGSKSTSCTLSAIRLSQNSNFQWWSRSCLCILCIGLDFSLSDEADVVRAELGDELANKTAP